MGRRTPSGDDALREAIARGLRWLGRREHCRAELIAKLVARGYAPAIAEAAADALARRGWLSDARFAESFLRARIARGDAPWLAARKAEARGADPAAVAAALAAIEDAFDAEQALRARIARLDPDGALRRTPSGRARLFRRLQRRGFDADTIRRALDALDEKENPR